MNPDELSGFSQETKRLIAGLLLPIFAWAAHLFTSYALAEWLCLAKADGAALHHPYLFAVLSLCSLLACLVGAGLAYRVLQQQPKPKSVALFLAYTAIILNAYLLVTILVQSLPLIMVPLC